MPLNFRLDGKVALITGAGRGIGLGMAHALAEQGCAIAIQDIDLKVARTEADRIIVSGGRAIAIGGDVTKTSEVTQWIERTRKNLGGLHILINNASIQVEKHWDMQTPDEIRRQWDANWITPLVLCRAAAKIFRKQKWGRIINLGSIQQRLGNPGMLPYSASKAALVSLTTALASDLADSSVTVNLISPGFFNTYRNRHHFKNSHPTAAHAKWIPLQKVGDARDVAGVTVLLCSDEGAYITGQTIFVDGGLSAR